MEIQNWLIIYISDEKVVVNSLSFFQNLLGDKKISNIYIRF